MTLNPFRMPTSQQKVASELALAKLSLLDAHTNVELAQTQLEKSQADLRYHQARVKRLSEMHSDPSAMNVARVLA